MDALGFMDKSLYSLDPMDSTDNINMLDVFESDLETVRLFLFLHYFEELERSLERRFFPCQSEFCSARRGVLAIWQKDRACARF